MIHKKKVSLAEYINRECIIKKAFAKKIGVSEPTLLLYIKALRIPTLTIAYKIEEATHGAVPVSSWLKEDLNKKDHE